MNKKKIAALISVLVLMAASAGASYAWFINYQANKLSGNNVYVKSGDAMTISLKEEGPYTNTVSCDFSDIELNHVSGDGKNMYFPALNQVYNEERNETYAVPAGSDSSAWSVAVSSADCEAKAIAASAAAPDYSEAQYIKFDVYFQANTMLDIYLGSQSELKPSTEFKTGSDIERKSEYGNFTKDFIAGAARVALLDQDDNVKMIWAPNPGIKLEYVNYTDDPDKPFGWKLTTDGSPESYGYYEKKTDGSFAEVKATATDIPFFSELPSVDLNDELPKNAVKLISLEKKEGEEGLYTGHIKVCIWIEGTDREARRALAGGMINTELQFLGFGHRKDSSE